MKNRNYLTLILLVFASLSYAQESDLMGEDFDLEALPGIIETVNNFEELEKAINDSTNDINNLDLNNDGEVDYVLIQEEAEGETHVAFIRVALSEEEFQDVASIEMEKLSSTTASFQIVGDEALYGKDYILEPEGGVVDISENTDVEPSGGGKGAFSLDFDVSPLLVRVTVCTAVFRPHYVAYVSPYGFVLRPVWFRPWRRVGRSSFRARSSRHHRNSFRRTSHRRSGSAHSMQKKGRKTSKKSTSHKSSNVKKSQKSSTTKNSQKSNTQHKQNTTKKGGNTSKKKRR